MEKSDIRNLVAPEIDRLVESIHEGMGVVDNESLELLDPIINAMKKIETEDPDDLRRIWIEVPRGDISKFGDYQEYLEEEVVDDYQGFVEEWKGYYPNDNKWYDFALSTYEDHYYFFFNSKYLFQTGEPINGKGTGCPSIEFLEWLKIKVEETIRKLEDGSYNQYLKENLPYAKRFGRIIRSEYWKINPNDRKMVRGDLSDKDIEELKDLVSCMEDINPIIRSMTAKDFYDYCQMGYLANDYKRIRKEEMTSKEMYYAMADGRDCGLKDVELDSEEAFRYWYHHGAHCGGHPWEICSGGNSTHISLYVREVEGGWQLTLAGSSCVRVLETVKMALALFRNSIPFQLHEAEEILRMVSGTDYIGIVPEWMTPRYCSSHFPKEDRIIDCMNLGHEEVDMIIEKAHWYPIKEVRLKGTN
jgi:hypothetical protein